MQFTRTQTVLASILFVQVVLILLLRSPLTGGGAAPEPGLLLPELADREPLRIELVEGEGDPLTLERSGEAWSIPEAGGYPADPVRVSDLLDRLRNLRVSRPVVRNARYHDSLEVTEDAPQARVRLWGAGDDEPMVTLLFGSSPNYRTIHLRRADRDEVYEVRDLATYDVAANPASWVNRKFLDVPEDDVVSARIENASGIVAIERSADGWSMTAPGAGPADPDEVAGLLSAISTLQLADPAGPLDEAAQGFDRPAAVLTLRVGGDEEGAAPREIVLRVGAPVPDNDSQRFVARSGFEFAGRVWASSVERLIEEDGGELRGS